MISSKFQWWLHKQKKRLWLRTTSYGCLGVFTAVIGIYAHKFIPWSFSRKFDAEVVEKILTILASSMLAVTTFSLNILISAFSSATANVTPRATKLILEDSVTQRTLSTFVGAFLFSLVGIIALSLKLYGQQGIALTFFVMLFVLTAVVLTLLRWIEHLSKLGRLGFTTDIIETATTQAIRERIKNPYIGCQPLRDPDREVPADATPIMSDKIGYVEHLDIELIGKWQDGSNCKIWIKSIPGSFVHTASVLAWSQRCNADEATRIIRKAYTIGNERSYEQDPRFGLCVLAEIASRGLSAAINDIGTPIEVINRGHRVLTMWKDRDTALSNYKPQYKNLWFPPIKTADLFEDFYGPISRDAAGIIEVQTRLLKSLLGLSQIGGKEYSHLANKYAQLALERSEAAIKVNTDLMTLRNLLDQFNTNKTL